MAHKTCPNCGTAQPHDYIFCAECGTRLNEVIEESQPAIDLAAQKPDFNPGEFAAAPESPPPHAPAPTAAPRREARPAVPPAAPHPIRRKVEWTLVHLSRAGGTNEPFPVPDSGIEIGSFGCAINFADDRTLSPRHATAMPGADGLQIEDAGSVNGVFLKVSGGRTLAEGDVFVCGDSVFRFSGDAASITPEDFRLFAAPDEACPRGTVTKILAGGADGPVFAVGGRPVTIGREGADISCPEDRYMSRVHAAVEMDNGALMLKDRQSRNGTYIKTPGHLTGRDGDVLLVGRQLLRIEARVL